jgi:hypothetical protein
MGELIQMPRRRPMQVIMKLVQAGYLREEDRNNRQAVERAWERLRKNSQEFFKSLGDRGDGPSVA